MTPKHVSLRRPPTWTRRQFLARTVAVATGGMVAYVAAKLGWHEYKEASVRAPRKRRPGKVLTEHEYETLKALADIIVPSDDLGPGAADVGAADTIERWLMQDSDHLKRYRSGLAWLDQAAAYMYGPGTFFVALTPQQQEALLQEAAHTAAELRRPATNILDRAWRYWDRLMVTLFGLGAGVFFLNVVRDDVFEAVYSHPKTWAVLGYDGPPQPMGYWNGANGDWNIIDDCPPTKREDFPPGQSTDVRPRGEQGALSSGGHHG